MVEQRFWVFDLDDTLFAEADYVRSALCWVGDFVSRLYGINDAAEQLLALKQAGAVDAIGDLWVKAALPSSAREAVVAAMRAHLPDIALRPGARAVLDEMRATGDGFGIMTNGRSVTQRAKLAALGCLDARLILISEESGWQKPDARCYQYFADRLPVRQFGYVGDNPAKDFVGANAAGWRTIMLKDDGRHIHRQDVRIAAGAAAGETVTDWLELAAKIVR
jgi:putative hydrolase of the HAD superfamily